MKSKKYFTISSNSSILIEILSQGYDECWVPEWLYSDYMSILGSDFSRPFESSDTMTLSPLKIHLDRSLNDTEMYVMVAEKSIMDFYEVING